MAHSRSGGLPLILSPIACNRVPLFFIFPSQETPQRTIPRVFAFLAGLALVGSLLVSPGRAAAQGGVGQCTVNPGVALLMGTEGVSVVASAVWLVSAE
jgi:hypothetical protein